MTDTQKATPRPWHIGKTYGRINRRVPIYPDTPTLGQLVVCEAGGEGAEANAALIVTAANAYDAMRNALVEARTWIPLRKGADVVIAQIDAALKAAEGKVE